jgi:hypothetical protein
MMVSRTTWERYSFGMFCNLKCNSLFAFHMMLLYLKVPFYGGVWGFFSSRWWFTVSFYIKGWTSSH